MRISSRHIAISVCTIGLSIHVIANGVSPQEEKRIHNALFANKLEIVKSILGDQPENINPPIDIEKSAEYAKVFQVNEEIPLLNLAAFWEAKGILTFLLDNNASQSINEGDRQGNTALHVAAYSGNKDIVQMLLDNGANPNIKNNSQLTPLYLAVVSSHPESPQAVKLIIESSAFESDRNMEISPQIPSPFHFVVGVVRPPWPQRFSVTLGGLPEKTQILLDTLPKEFARKNIEDLAPLQYALKSLEIIQATPKRELIGGASIMVSNVIYTLIRHPRVDVTQVEIPPQNQTEPAQLIRSMQALHGIYEHVAQLAHVVP